MGDPTWAVLRVTRDQVEAARGLIHLRGGADRVAPILARIAAFQPARADVTGGRQQLRVTRDQVEAARGLTRLRGGADRVSPLIARVAQVRLARDTPR